MILVTGSTGKIGQHLIPALRAKGATFKALAHSPASLQALRAQGTATWAAWSLPSRVCGACSCSPPGLASIASRSPPSRPPKPPG